MPLRSFWVFYVYYLPKVSLKVIVRRKNLPTPQKLNQAFEQTSSSPLKSKDTACRWQVLTKSRVPSRAPEPWMSEPPSWPPVTPGPLVPGVGAPSSDGAWGHAGAGAS